MTPWRAMLMLGKPPPDVTCVRDLEWLPIRAKTLSTALMTTALMMLAAHAGKGEWLLMQ